MITNDLLSFIKEQLATGMPEADIRKVLVDSGGWDDSDVKEAFDAIGIYSNTYQGAVEKAFHGSQIAAGESAPAPAPASMASGAISSKESSAMPTLGVMPSSSPAITAAPKTIIPVQEPAPVHVISMREQLGASMGSSPVSPLGQGTSIGQKNFRAPAPNVPEWKPITPASPPANIPYTPPTASQPPVSSPPPSTISQPLSSASLAYSTPPATLQTAPAINNSPLGMSPGIAPGPRVSIAGGPASSPNPFLDSFAAAKSVKPAPKVPEMKVKKKKGFSYFLLFLFVIIIFAVGVLFAYYRGLLGISIPFLDTIKSQVPALSSLMPADETNDATGSGIVINGDGLMLDTSSGNTESAPETQAPIFFTDRILVLLPSGSVSSVSSIASTIASEERGRVIGCTYSPENSCIITVPAEDTAGLDKIITDLKTDKRLRGVEKVPMK